MRYGPGRPEGRRGRGTADQQHLRRLQRRFFAPKTKKRAKILYDVIPNDDVTNGSLRQWTLEDASKHTPSEHRSGAAKACETLERGSNCAAEKERA